MILWELRRVGRKIGRFFSGERGSPQGYFISPSRGLVTINVVGREAEISGGVEERERRVDLDIGELGEVLDRDVLEERVAVGYGAEKMPASFESNRTPKVKTYVDTQQAKPKPERVRGYRETIDQIFRDVTYENPASAGRITREEVESNFRNYLREKFEERAASHRISGKRFAEEQGISQKTLYQVVGKGRIKELREERIERVLGEYREAYRENPKIKVTDFCRKHEISPSSFYAHARKNGGIEALRGEAKTIKFPVEKKEYRKVGT